MNEGYQDEAACGCSNAAMEDALNSYADGELATEKHAGLFRHLADCPDCRARLEALMTFRQLTRSVSIQVPPMADAALMARLDVLKRREESDDATHSLWETRMNVGLGKAATAIAAFFLLGLGFSGAPRVLPASDVSVSQEVVVPHQGETFWRVEPVYVFYPGLTIEADKVEE